MIEVYLLKFRSGVRSSIFFSGVNPMKVVFLVIIMNTDTMMAKKSFVKKKMKEPHPLENPLGKLLTVIT
jgi:hypothetical protein